MAVAPTSRIAIIADKVRNLVAASTTFQTLVGAVDQAAALGRVYLAGRNTVIVPYALVTPSEFSMTKDSAHWNGSREYIILFVGAISAANDDDDKHEDAWYAFANDFGAVVDEMATAIADQTADITNVSAISGGMLERTKREHRASIGDQFVWEVTITVEPVFPA